MRRYTDKLDRRKKLMMDKAGKAGKTEANSVQQAPRATKGDLKRIKEFKQAINDSLRSASAVTMNRKEEDTLLDLIAMLENVQISKPDNDNDAADTVGPQAEQTVVAGGGSANSANQIVSPAQDSLEVVRREGSAIDVADRSEDQTGSDDLSVDDVNSLSDDEANEELSHAPSSSSSEESSNDNDDDDESANEEPLAPESAPVTADSVIGTTPAVLGRQKFIRKVIRDERRYVREQQELHKLQPPVERVVARLRQSLKPTTAPPVPAAAPAQKRSEAHTGPILGTAVVKSPATTSASASQQPSPPVAGATVRVNAHYDKAGNGKKRPGPAKLMVVDRSLSVADLLATLRARFNATAVVKGRSGGGGKDFKYNAARVFSTGQVLTAAAWAAPKDGESLTLFGGGVEEAGDEDAAALSTGASPEPTEPSLQVGAAPVAGGAQNSGEVEDAQLAASVDEGTSPINAALPSAPAYWVPPTLHTDSDSDAATNQSALRRVDSEGLRRELEAALSDPAHAPMLEQRRSLPIHHKRDELLALIAHHQVVVVSGETGSGKTTQLPQYLMEHMVLGGRAADCNVLCSQPRRIAAVSVAERVHKECAQEGPVGSGLVGYQVRLDSRVSAKTRLTYCTTGVLLRRLQDPRCLQQLSHIVLDEVHERGVESDFLMTLLKQKMAQHPHLKIILMSATMKEEAFSAYFGNCPIVYVSGRSYPVTVHYLGDVHELVGRGQRQQAAEAGKLLPAPGPGGKRAGKGADSLDATEAALRPPKFDPELVAELVIRIMTTSHRDTKPAQAANRTGSAALSDVNSTSEAYTGAESATETKAGSETGPVARNRLAKIQADAARARVKTSAIDTAGDPAAVGTQQVPSALSRVVASFPTDTGGACGELPPVAGSQTGEAILVFLSGIQAINKVSAALRQRGIMQRLKAEVHVLHGLQSAELQRRVFRRTKPGEWKIVLTTNIAETSITVDDVTHVVDSGFVKEVRFDPASGVSSLQEVFVSRVSARQRAGRAGRVRAGSCWRLYAEDYFLSHRVDEHPLPEIQRVPLEEVVLQVLLLKLGAPEVFLGQCMEPPSIQQVRAALACLLEVGAVLPLQELPLTALGYHLARMPVDVHVGKMLIYASLLGCLEPVLTIAAALGGKSPFYSPLDPVLKEEANRSHRRFLMTHYTSDLAYAHGAAEADKRQESAAENCFSDHLAVVNAYDQWQHITRRHGLAAARKFCQERFLAPNVLADMLALREHFRGYLRQTGFLTNRDRGSREATNRAGDGAAEGPVTAEDTIEEAAELVDAEIAVEIDDAAQTDPSKALGQSNVKEPELQDSDDQPRLSPRAMDNLVRCALCAGLYPQIARLGKFRELSSDGKKAGNPRSKGARGVSMIETIKVLLPDRTEVSLHPSCLLSGYTRSILDQSGRGEDSEGAQDKTSEDRQSHYGLKLSEKEMGQKDALLVYYKKMAFDRLFLFDCTVVPHAAVLLFSGASLAWHKNRDRVTVGGWIDMRITELHCALYRRLQREIDSLMRAKVEDPCADIRGRQRLLTHIVQMLVEA